MDSFTEAAINKQINHVKVLLKSNPEPYKIPYLKVELQLLEASLKDYNYLKQPF